MSFQDESLDLPDPVTISVSGSATLNQIANVQFNPTTDIISLNMINGGGGIIPQYITDSTTSQTSYNKVQVTSDFSVVNDTITIAAGKYWHDIAVVFTVSNPVPTGNSDILCELTDETGTSYTDDTHYVATELSNADNIYVTGSIKTLIEHSVGDKVRLKFASSTNNDRVKIKQIKWIILQYAT